MAGLRTELERQIDAAMSELTACQGTVGHADEIRLGLSVSAGGSIETRIYATTLSSCAIIDCIERHLNQFSIVPSLRPVEVSTIEWNVLLGPNQAPRFVEPDAPAEQPAKSYVAAAACVDGIYAGRLSPQVIRELVHAQFGKFKACYEHGLAKQPTLAGEVTVRFDVGADGKVSALTILENQLTDCAVAECVVDAFAGIEFPPPGGGVVSVIYPISLQPG
jgi:hypothetical protein